MKFKNLKRNLNGSIDGDWIQDDESVKRYTLDASMGHIEKAESGVWGDIEEPTQAEKDAHEAEQTRLAFKADRAAKVNSLTVETSLGIFDADELSQTRMSRAISVMTDADVNLWVLADNTPIEVTKADLVEVLILAGKAQSALWVQP